LDGCWTQQEFIVSPNHSILSDAMNKMNRDLTATNAAEPIAPISWLTYSLDWGTNYRGALGLK
jgi:hypothetical protein